MRPPRFPWRGNSRLRRHNPVQTPSNSFLRASMAATLRSARDFLKQRLLYLLGALMSLNDPNWGRRPGGSNQGPPDLEELWRNFNRKLEGLFGRRGGGSDEPGGRSPRRI